MVAQNNLREITKIIYRLKRNFGLEMMVWHPTNTSQNILTGEIVRSYSTQYVRRGIFLPARLIRDFAYDLAYIAAAKNFTYGAYYDDTQRFVVIDAKDLTSGFEFTQQDYISFQNQWYNVKEIHEAENRKGWMLILKALSNTDIPSPYSITGTLVPDVTGNFFTNGQYNDETSYQNMRGTWWIWFETDSWYISQTKGVAAGDYWSNSSLTITDIYSPNGAASGDATVVSN